MKLRIYQPPTSRGALMAVRVACLLTLAGYCLKLLAYNGRLLPQIFPETFVAWAAGLFGVEWLGFFPGGTPNPRYLAFVYAASIIYAAGTMASLGPAPARRMVGRAGYTTALGLSAFLILVTGFAAFVGSQLHLNMLLEYSIQITVSLLFLHYALGRPVTSRLMTGIALAVALTFTGHGLYAMNVFPIPGNFLLMTSNILHTDRSFSLAFLFTAGVLDLVCAAAIFLRPTARLALAYMVFWGFVTALARPVAWFGATDTATWAAMWIPEFLLRSGHWLLPLYLLLHTRKTEAPTALNTGRAV